MLDTSILKTVDNVKGVMDRRIFSDPDIYKKELEQVFGRCWLFLGHESQVPKPNDFIAGYMGEDPILLTRDSKGKLHAFLNMCRHRGNRICRADAGNAPSFMCTYHGWTFSTDGKLVGVPGYKEAYFEELDRSQWGLVEAGQIGSYKGLVFATWDKQAPNLDDYLSNMAWYLDLLVDRREGGTEVLGISRWMLKSNWKFPADNFGADGYHGPITHGSVTMLGYKGEPQRNPYARNANSLAVTAANGHILVGFSTAEIEMRRRYQNFPPNIQDYFISTTPELEKRLGKTRADRGTIPTSTVFPNMSTHTRAQLRMYHPRGPELTEMWIYCIVDKEAPLDIKTSLKAHLAQTFGPSGGLEVDDMNNWVQCTDSGHYTIGKRYPMNQQMGLGHESSTEKFPGKVAQSHTELNQRNFYGKWAEMMAAPSWNEVHLDPKDTRFIK